MWLLFLSILCNNMLYFKRKFVWFKVPLNHRLVRKLSKALDKVPEDTLLYRPELRNLKKYLKRMRKNNFRRFFKWQRTPKIEKRIRDRHIWVSANWAISICTSCPNPQYVTVYDNSIISFDTLIYILIHKGEHIPF